jgi:hypothetical protein
MVYGVSMAVVLSPRFVTAVLVEEEDDCIRVTWDLREPVPVDNPGYFGYEVRFCGVDGDGGKQFSVRVHDKTTAHMWDDASGTHTDYAADNIAVTETAIAVNYRGVKLGLETITAMAAFTHINGADRQVGLPVVLMR